MNPFTWFMQLKPVVKMTLIICSTLVMCLFMYFAAQTDTFELLIRSLFTETKK